MSTVSINPNSTIESDLALVGANSANDALLNPDTSSYVELVCDAYSSYVYGYVKLGFTDITPIPNTIINSLKVYLLVENPLHHCDEFGINTTQLGNSTKSGSYYYKLDYYDTSGYNAILVTPTGGEVFTWEQINNIVITLNIDLESTDTIKVYHMYAVIDYSEYTPPSTTPNIKLRIDGAIRSYNTGWIRIDGTLKTITDAWTRVDGVLKKL